jgi:uncharacterized membrane protein
MQKFFEAIWLLSLISTVMMVVCILIQTFGYLSAEKFRPDYLWHDVKLLVSYGAIPGIVCLIGFPWALRRNTPKRA